MTTSTCVALVLVGALLSACDTRKDVPPPTNPSTTLAGTPSVSTNSASDAEVARGGRLFGAMVAKNPETKLDVWGSASPEVKACLWIAEDDWGSLSSEDQAALIAWLKAQIPAIRSSPDRYARTPSSAPLYGRIRSNIANMRDGAFIVFTMVRKDREWIQSKTVAESK